MAETSFARINSTTPIARAEVNAGAPDLDAAVRTTRGDPRSYLPLHPSGPLEGGWSPPEPPTYTEAELRLRLGDALAASHIADTARADAENAHERATRHAERCQCDLNRFANLDGELAADAAARLRDGVDLTSPATEFMAKIHEREAARAQLAAARAAAALLERERDVARAGATKARAATDRIVAGIAAFAADRIAERHAEILAEAGRLAALLHGFNQSFVASGPRLSPEVRAILMSDPALLARRADQGPWRDAAERLRADPAAEVEIL